MYTMPACELGYASSRKRKDMRKVNMRKVIEVLLGITWTATLVMALSVALIPLWHNHVLTLRPNTVCFGWHDDTVRSWWCLP